MDPFIESYKTLYKSLTAAEASIEDLEQWMHITSKQIVEIQDILNDKYLRRNRKYSLETSLAHFLSIQQELENRLKRGGELTADSVRVKWTDVKTAFNSRVRKGVIVNIEHLDFNQFMDDVKVLFISRIKDLLKQYNSIKVNTALSAKYTKIKNEKEEEMIFQFNTKNVSVFKTTDLSNRFEECIRKSIDTQMSEFQEQGSGWSLKRILHVAVNINKLNPMRVGSYIPLPKDIAIKHACVNVKNEDEQCFKWSVLAGLYPKSDHAERVSHYKKYDDEKCKDRLKFEGIEFPVDPQNIAKFEKQNDVSVNCYILTRKQTKAGKDYHEVSPLHVTSSKQEEHVNLLLLQDYYPLEEEEDGEEDIFTEIKYHYVLIKSLSRLISSQVSTYEHKCFVCERCLNYFWKQEKLVEHEIDCSQMNQYRIILPKKNESILQFRNHNNSERVPVIVYADCESLLKPREEDDPERVENNHKLLSIGYYVKYSDDVKDASAISQYKMYRQRDETQQSPAEWFIKELVSIVENLQRIYENIQPMVLTINELQEFAKAKTCHICNKSFTKKDIKVKDHCHLSGKYRGAAHQSCNLNYNDARFVPVVFHNLSGYDCHLIIKAIASNVEGRIKLIPQNKERYISFSKYIEGCNIHLRFIDSFRFLPTSLSKLSLYLKEHPIVEQEFEKDEYTLEQIQLLKKKGVYPYDFTLSFDSLKVTKLPTKDEFYSHLYNESISHDDYAHALNVWNTFKMQNLGEYSDLYLKTDVLLLADVYEDFRYNCLDSYHLDPAHYYTTPGFSWDAMLKFTGVKLERLTDIDMLMFVERGIRGGVSQCSNRYAQANNKYMENFNKEEEESFLSYFDVNNLYGWAMVQHLPQGGFEWVEDLDYNFWDVPEDSSVGYFIEVDLVYPLELHDDHKDLPFCPEHRAAPGSKHEKLMATLYGKIRYVLHYRSLQQALQHGLVLKKIYRALKFKQSPWLMEYIDFNTARRAATKNDFEKMLYKLFNNAVYGKTMENERKRVDVRLVNKWEGRYGAEALIARPTFRSCEIIDEDLVVIQIDRTVIKIKKPVYIGMAVLDISKICVYRFHYDVMKNKLGDKCKLCYTDTDSLIYEIRDHDIYDFIRENINEFDTHDFGENNRFNLPQHNNKVLGKMKDECAGFIMTHFIGLRSKMYCVKIENQNLIKKAKGVKSNIVEKEIEFENYHDCLFNKELMIREQYSIRSRQHNVTTEKQSKIALSYNDDKRYLLPNTTDTLPWGHYRIHDSEEERSKKRKRTDSSEIDEPPRKKANN